MDGKWHHINFRADTVFCVHVYTNILLTYYHVHMSKPKSGLQWYVYAHHNDMPVLPVFALHSR